MKCEHGHPSPLLSSRTLRSFRHVTPLPSSFPCWDTANKDIYPSSHSLLLYKTKKKAGCVLCPLCSGRRVCSNCAVRIKPTQPSAFQPSGRVCSAPWRPGEQNKWLQGSSTMQVWLAQSKSKPATPVLIFISQLLHSLSH